MDDKKLKLAFSRVKKDIFAIAGDLDKVKNSIKDLSRATPAGVTKKDSRVEMLSAELDKMKGVLSGIQKELKELKPSSKSEVRDLIKSFKDSKKSVDMFEVKLLKFDERLKRNDDKLKDFSSLVEEKVVFELDKVKNELRNDAVGGASDDLSDLSELVQEKINLEISAMRLEFTDEIAKIYDKFFSEVTELKGDISKKGRLKKSKPEVVTVKRKKEIEREPEIVEHEEEEKEGFMKKFSRWLFIDYEDEEDDEIQSIKDEVKEKESEKKIIGRNKKSSASKKSSNK